MGRLAKPLDANFITSQKRRLQELKLELTEAKRARDGELEDSTEALSGEAHEYEDEAQHLTEYELNGQLHESIDRRLGIIDRALQKIDEGTYGESDLSGEAIAIERLRALPEAIYTRQEQQARDVRH